MKKTFKYTIITLLMVTFALAFTGCANNSKTDSASTAKDTAYPYTYTDSKGDSVTIESEPQKIVSVAPSVTETVFALGKGSELVGRTDYCNYPDEAKSVESIGSLTDPNIEKIIELKPDVVIGSTHFKDDVKKKLEDLGIKIVVLDDAKTIDSAYDSILKVGNILNANKEANDIVDSNKKKIEEIQSKIKDAPSPKVYYAVGFGKGGDYTATGDTFIADMLDKAGADNIAKNDTKWAYSLEKIIQNDPEYIILSKNFSLKSEFVATDGYKDFTAVKNNKVYEVDDDLVNRQGPRISEGVEALAKIIHPDLFK